MAPPSETMPGNGDDDAMSRNLGIIPGVVSQSERRADGVGDGRPNGATRTRRGEHSSTQRSAPFPPYRRRRVPNWREAAERYGGALGGAVPGSAGHCPARPVTVRILISHAALVMCLFGVDGWPRSAFMPFTSVARWSSRARPSSRTELRGIQLPRTASG